MDQSTHRPRIVIAEDFVLIQENIRKVVRRDCDVVAAVEDGPAAVDAVSRYAADVLLVDLSLPGMNGFAIAEHLKNAGSPVAVVVVTAHSDAEYMRRALEAGAKGYVLKGCMWTELPAAICAVMSGATYISPRLAA